MTKVKFGPIYTRIEDLMGPVELAEKAESWGYDSFWVPDYILKPRLDALIVLGAAAQRHFHHPTRYRRHGPSL